MKGLYITLILLYSQSALAITGSAGLKVEDGQISGSPKVEVFDYISSAAQVWYKPSWATFVYIWCVGPGQGGVGGKKIAWPTPTPAPGATPTPTPLINGGNSGTVVDVFMPASELPSTLNVFITAGSAGGAGATTSNSNGSPIGLTTATRVARTGATECSTYSQASSECLIFAYNGIYTYGLQWAGWDFQGLSPWLAKTQTCQASASYAPGVGGAGGQSDGTATAGWVGNAGCMSPSSGGTAGAAGGGAGGVGGTYTGVGLRVGGGGGGGGGSITPGVNGGRGGDGGVPGGGGGGGGAGLNATNNGGAGGKGGDGQCVFISF